MARWLTYQQAARRVGRDERSVRRWQREGMPMSTTPDGRRIVLETVLLEWYRQKLINDPAHQHRMRRILAEYEAKAG